MTLSEYIREHGDEACAKRWGMSARGVAAWRRGERKPEPWKAKEIIRESGVLTWDAIYGSPHTDAA